MTSSITSTVARPVVVRSAVAVLAAAGVVGLTACGSSSGGIAFGPSGGPSTSAVANASSSAAPTTAAPTTAAPTTAAPATATPATASPRTATPAPTQAPTSGVAAASLLSQIEIGYGFTRTAGNASDGPLPCTPSRPGPLTQVPAADHAQIDFTSPRQDAQITERVIRYADAAQAQQAVTVVRAGFGCDTADVGGAKLYVVGPNDVRPVVTANVDSADDWDLRSGEFQSEMIVVRAGTVVVQLAFSRVSGAQPTDLDPSQVLEAAIAKAVNGG